MVNSQPVNLLSRKYENWNALFLSAVDAVIGKIKAQRDGYSHYTVGDKNATRIQHPMGAAIPLLGPWLNMPKDRLPRRPVRYASNPGAHLWIFTSDGCFSWRGKGRVPDHARWGEWESTVIALPGLS